MSNLDNLVAEILQQAQKEANRILTKTKAENLEFIEPSKKHAYIIIPRGGENTPAIEMLVQHLKTFLDKNEKK